MVDALRSGVHVQIPQTGDLELTGGIDGLCARWHSATRSRSPTALIWPPDTTTV